MEGRAGSESALWRLENGRAMRLPTQTAPRRLRVRDGRLWLTTLGRPDEMAADVWLGPGDEMSLPDGERWVAEAWPQASFEILVTPAGEQAPAGVRRSAPVPWQRWLDVLQRRRSAV